MISLIGKVNNQIELDLIKFLLNRPALDQFN